MGAHSFGKAERLHSKKLIQELFTKGSSFYLHPFKVIVLPHPAAADSPHQVLVSVSKRNFKKAVDRNTIKRRTREAYRLQKQLLVSGKPLLVGFLFTSKIILASADIHKGMEAALKKISKNAEG